jgi:hypothetical protein
MSRSHSVIGEGDLHWSAARRNKRRASAVGIRCENRRNDASKKLKKECKTVQKRASDDPHGSFGHG